MSAPADITTLAELPARQAARTPDKIALVDGDRQMTFAQLDQASNRLAHGLIAAGLRPGARVAVMDRNALEFFPIVFGTARAGGVIVTVNFRLTAKEIAYILGDAGAEIVFVGAEFASEIEACRAALPELKRVIVIGGEGDVSFDAFLAARPQTAPERAPHADDTAVQMYTSGTTGHPKGVELSHGAMICAARDGLTVWPAMFRPDAAVLVTMPLFHIAACNLAIAGLFAGARADIIRGGTPEEIIRHIAERKIAVVPLPAALIHEIIKLPLVTELDLSHLDTLLIAGSGIPVELLREAQQVLKCGFALSYGMTECCGGLTYLGPADCTHDAGEKLKSAGKPLGRSRIRIVDAHGKDLPPGEIGEIVCHSDRVMKGYWNRPDATREAMRKGWYHSGDAGYLDEDGYLYVVDRIKDMVVSGGENIYPVEIENELIQHPAIDDVAVIGVPDEKWGEALLACVIPKPGMTVEDAEVIEFLRPRLAGYKIPRRYEVMDAFPRNASGKVLKRVMRTDHAAR